MSATHHNDPLHGITLEKILLALVEHRGWTQMADEVPIRCFMFDPTITSSLKFLRRTPWARQKVEGMYLDLVLRGIVARTPVSVRPPQADAEKEEPAPGRVSS